MFWRAGSPGMRPPVWYGKGSVWGSNFSWTSLDLGAARVTPHDRHTTEPVLRHTPPWLGGLVRVALMALTDYLLVEDPDLLHHEESHVPNEVHG